MARYPDGYTMDLSGHLVPLAPANPRQISVRRFMGRLSIFEQIALTQIRIDPATPIETRAQLETLKDLRDNTQDKLLNLDDDDMALGAGVAILELTKLPDGTPGRIEPADAMTRIAAWLADYPQPGEPTS